MLSEGRGFFERLDDPIFRSVKVGTCGFYTSQSRHFSSLNALEINITFYREWKPERARLLKEKALKVNPDFTFTAKAFQGFTHPPGSLTWRRSHVPREERKKFSPLTWSDAVLSQNWFFEVVGILRPPVLLFQMPPFFKFTQQNIEKSCMFFEKYPQIFEELSGCVPDVVLEVRKWTPEERKDFFEALASCLPSSTSKSSVNFRIDEAVDPLLFGKPAASGNGVACYFRLHKTLPGYRGSHDEGELRRLREYVFSCRPDESKPAFVFFNNQFAYADALRFIEILK